MQIQKEIESGNLKNALATMESLKIKGHIPEHFFGPFFKFLRTAKFLNSKDIHHFFLLADASSNLSPRFYSNLISTAKALGDHNKVEHYWVLFRTSKMPLDIPSFVLLVTAFGEKQSPFISRVELLDNERKISGLKLDLISFNALISAYAHNIRVPAALALLDEIRKSGLKPDPRSYNSLLWAYAIAKDSSNFNSLYKRMIDDCGPQSENDFLVQKAKDYMEKHKLI